MKRAWRWSLCFLLAIGQFLSRIYLSVTDKIVVSLNGRESRPAILRSSFSPFNVFFFCAWCFYYILSLNLIFVFNHLSNFFVYFWCFCVMFFMIFVFILWLLSFLGWLQFHFIFHLFVYFPLPFDLLSFFFFVFPFLYLFLSFAFIVYFFSFSFFSFFLTSFPFSFSLAFFPPRFSFGSVFSFFLSNLLYIPYFLYFRSFLLFFLFFFHLSSFNFFQTFIFICFYFFISLFMRLSSFLQTSFFLLCYFFFFLKQFILFLYSFTFKDRINLNRKYISSFVHSFLPSVLCSTALLSYFANILPFITISLPSLLFECINLYFSFDFSLYSVPAFLFQVLQ